MNQFKDVFLGKEQRDYKRAASSQKCMRVSGKHNDLENVGPSPSHHTFFQMLGNFSFGDYFKKEAIGFAWELLTNVWKIPKDKLFVTVFKGEGGIPRDVEAREFWLTYVSEDHLSELGSDDNFWQMGETGPCGRCSEIYYFRGNQIPCPEPVCRGVECSCSRYIEIWNNVFMEFDRQPDGSLKPLPAPSIDTGMGLERITAVLQGHESNYDTDLFGPILDEIGTLAGRKYGRSMRPDDVSMRVVADHARTATFLIADGVMPSNEFRGYVLRKIMRRAMRHGMKLGITETFLPRLVDVIAREMGDAYPELRSNRDTVVSVVRNEEERFSAVLAGGLPKLEEAIERAAASSGRTVAGRRGVQAVRHVRSAPRLHRRPRGRTAGRRRPRGVRPRDGRPAREGARKERFRRQEGTGVRLCLRPGAAGPHRGRRPLRGLHDDDRQRHAGHRAVRQGTPAGEGVEGRIRGIRGTWPDAVLRRGRRTGIGRRLSPRGRIGGIGERWRNGAYRRRHAAAAPHPADERNAAGARHHHRGSGRTRRATPRAGITQRRICFTPRCGRCWDRT